jgi:predicted nucleic acid-binding protein
VIILLDTDILLDVAFDRAPHAVPAARVLDLCQQGSINGFTAWHSVANFYYLASPVRGEQDSRRFLIELIEFIEVAPTATDSLRYAARLAVKDLEDAMQVAAAAACGAEAIATRNVRDYSRSPIRAVTPAALLRELR